MGFRIQGLGTLTLRAYYLRLQDSPSFQVDILKRALYLFKRALYLFKRALYLFKRAVYLLKEPCILSKEPFPPQKRPLHPVFASLLLDAAAYTHASTQTHIHTHTHTRRHITHAHTHTHAYCSRLQYSPPLQVDILKHQLPTQFAM